MSHPILADIYLSYNSLNFITHQLNYKQLIGSISKQHYELIKKNHTASDEVLAVCASITSDINLVKIKLLNDFYNTDLQLLFRCINCVCICDHYDLAKILLDFFSNLFGHWAMCDIDGDEARDCVYYSRYIFRLALKLGKRKFMKILLNLDLYYYVHREYENYLKYYYEKGKYVVVKNIIDMTDIFPDLNPEINDKLLVRTISDQKPELAYFMMTHPKIKFKLFK